MFALMATKTGRHPQKFVPRFSGPFGHIYCYNDRKLETMYNIPTPRSKLLKPGTRTPFNSQGLSAEMPSAFVDLFRPPKGIILDAYAGRMRTAISALGSGRSCICIEINSNCFSAPVQRLRQLLPGSSVARSIKIQYRRSVVGRIHGNRKSWRSNTCLLYTSPSPRDQRGSRMPSSA